MNKTQDLKVPAAWDINPTFLELPLKSYEYEDRLEWGYSEMADEYDLDIKVITKFIGSKQYWIINVNYCREPLNVEFGVKHSGSSYESIKQTEQEIKNTLKLPGIQ